MTKALLLLVVFVGVAATEDDDFGPRPAGWMTRGSNGTAGGGNKSSGGKAIHVCTVNKFSDAVKNGTTTPLWGTLRRCITDLNKLAIPGRIEFAFKQKHGHSWNVSINLTTPLPPIQQTMVIDATTQPPPLSPSRGWVADLPRIVISGEHVLGCFIGLEIKAPDVTIIGLGVTDFLGAGIMISAPRAKIVGGAVFSNTLGSGVAGGSRRHKRANDGGDDGDDGYAYDDAWTHMNKNYNDDDWWAPGWECDQSDSIMYGRLKGGIVVEDAGVNASIGEQPPPGQESPQTLYIYDNNVGPGMITTARWTTLTNAWVGIRPDGSRGSCGCSRVDNPDDFMGLGVLNPGGVHVLGADMTLGTDGGVRRTYVGNNAEVGVIVRGQRFTCVNTAVGLNPIDGSNSSSHRGFYLYDSARDAQIGRQGSHNRTWVAWHEENGISSTAPRLVVENSAFGLTFDGSPAPNHRGISILTAAGASSRIGSLSADANLTYFANSKSSAIKSHGSDMVVAACAIGFTFNGTLAANEYGVYVEGPRAIIGGGTVRTHIGGCTQSDVYVKSPMARLENVAIGLDFELKSVSRNTYMIFFSPDALQGWIGKDGAPFQALIDVPQTLSVHPHSQEYSACICAIYAMNTLTIVNAQVGWGPSAVDVLPGDVLPSADNVCPSIGTAVHGGHESTVQIGVDGSPNKTFVLQQIGTRDAIKFEGNAKIQNAFIGIAPDGLPRKRIYNQDSFSSKGNLVSVESTLQYSVEIGGKLNKTYISDSWGSGLVVRTGTATISNVVVGLGPNGTPLPNLGDNGVHVLDKGKFVILKDSWVSGNAGTGVFLEGTGSTITNCSVGLGLDGEVQGNGGNGIVIGSGAGTTTVNTSIVGGNKLVGIVASADELVIGSGCRVGFDHHGKCVGNGGSGIQLASRGTQVGVGRSGALPVMVGCNNGVGIDARSAVDAEFYNVHIFGNGIADDTCEKLDDHDTKSTNVAPIRTARAPLSTAATHTTAAKRAPTQLVGIILGHNSSLNAGCIIQRAGGNGVVVVGQGNQISSSFICSNGANGVAVEQSGQIWIGSGSTVSHNVLDGISSVNGGLGLHDVKITNNAGNGVTIVGTSNANVPNTATLNATNCTISGNEYVGMLLLSVRQGKVANSTFANNSQQAGLVLNNTDSAYVVACNFTGNDRYGIWVQGGATQTSITSCTIVGSARSAMRNDAEGTILSRNYFSSLNNRDNKACRSDLGQAPCLCSSSAKAEGALPASATIECTNRALDFGLDFPLIWQNTTMLTVSAVGLKAVPWDELAALQPGLVSLDVSQNPQLKSIPPVGVVLPALENLDLSATDISALQNNSFFAAFKNLASLDLSGVSKLPQSANLRVNFTGLIQRLQTVLWFNSECPPGYWIASETNSVCTACPVGTWKPNSGPLQSDCNKCTEGTFDHDSDPTTRCIVIRHFEVSSFERADQIVRKTPARSALTWAVHDPVTISAVINLQKVHSSGGKTSFVANGLPSGLLIDPNSGMIAGSPLTGPTDLRGKLLYNVSFYARDEHAGFAKLEDIVVTVRYKDTADPANGPSRTGCAHGLAVDTIPFNQHFTCDCHSVSSSWAGPNCAKPANPWVVIGSVLGSLLFVVAFVFVGITVRRYKQKSKPFSFDDALTALAVDGIVTIDRRELDAHGTSPTAIMMGTFGKVEHSIGTCSTETQSSSFGTNCNHGIAELAKTPREISLSRLSFLKVVGSGAGGVVRSAMLTEPGTPAFMCVVKSPLTGASEKAREALLHEAALMAQFSHANVVSLIGVVTKFKNNMLVLQICDNGSLHNLLAAGAFHPGQEDISSECVLGIANDVATGMEYLSQRSFVHRDLAARNILVSADWICRVADFGLSRKLSQKEYYYVRSNSEDAFPLRWSAPEVVSLGHFSSKADVWSFGVLLFEVIARGRQPFRSSSNIQLVELLASGGDGAAIHKALPCSLHVGEKLLFVRQRLILSCLVTKLEDRPGFGTLLSWIAGELKVHKQSSGQLPGATELNGLEHKNDTEDTASGLISVTSSLSTWSASSSDREINSLETDSLL